MLTPEQVNQKLDVLEQDMQKLIAENERLIRERVSAYVELDTCVGLIARLAVAQGLVAGVAHKNTPQQSVVIELPAGQVSWAFGEEEDHLFEQLPEYIKPVEEIENQEKYYRVMNPGL